MEHRPREDVHSIPLKSPARPVAVSSKKVASASFAPSSPSPARETQLRTELDSVRQINSTLTALLASLDKTGSDLHRVESTLEDGLQLVDLYTDILSQSHHTTKLILDNEWGGVSKDLQAIEENLRRRDEEERDRAMRKQQEERQSNEDHEERQRRLDAEDEGRAITTSRATGRGRGRALLTGRRVGRAASGTANADSAPVGTSTGRFGAGDTSGVGRARGSQVARGRARGTRS